MACYRIQFASPFTIIAAICTAAVTVESHAASMMVSYVVPIPPSGSPRIVNHCTDQTPVYCELIECPEPVFNFGLAHGGHDIWVTYPIKNRSDKLIYLDIRYGCSCLFRKTSNGPILPGQTVYLTLQVDTANRSGHISKSFTVTATAVDDSTLCSAIYQHAKKLLEPMKPHWPSIRIFTSCIMAKLTS